MTTRVKQYLPWVLLGLIAALCIYLALNQNSGVTSVQLELKNQQITALSKDRDSLKVALAHWERINRDTTAKDSIRQYRATTDSMAKQLKASRLTQYELARRVKAAESWVNTVSGTPSDTSCVELANKVLNDSATIAALLETHNETVKTYESVLGVKDSLITAQSKVLAVDDALINGQRDAAALQSAELRKVKKQSKLKGTIAAIGGGLALVGWLIIAVK